VSICLKILFLVCICKHFPHFALSRRAPDPFPDLAGYPVNLVDPDRIRIWPDPMYLDPDPVPALSEVGFGKYWTDVRNYDLHV